MNKNQINKSGKYIWGLLTLLILASSCTPKKNKSWPEVSQQEVPATPQLKTMEQEILYDKMLGALAGSAIGDAMGAPTEMWDRHQMQVEYGHITGLDSMIREPSAEGTWSYNLSAGGTTDDTRWKALLVEFLSGTDDRVTPRQTELKAKDFAKDIMNRYESHLSHLKSLDSYELEPYETELMKAAWLKEWALVSKPYYEEELDAYSEALNKFYGGEMVCAGMLFSPVVGAFYPGDPAWAYEQTYNIDIFDLGYAKDISGLTAAMVAAAMTEESTPDSILGVMRSVDPKGYFKSRLVGRTAYKVYQDAQNIVFQAKAADPETVIKENPVPLAIKLKTRSDTVKYARFATAYKLLDEQLSRYPFHPSEIHIVNLTAMMLCDFDFQQSMEFIINFGRDNDTTAAVTGAILGAYWGAKKLPTGLLKQILIANKDLGFDLEKMAERMVESIVKGG